MKNYEALLSLFSKHLENYVASIDKREPKELYEPEKYILCLGGKRIRPLLSLVACDLFDENPELALNSALSIEVFHNFSLIHDDILDKAPIRRNQPTVHTKWNTDIAILSGDAMLVKAFDILTQSYPNQLHLILKLFTKTIIEVCEGQQMDMNFEKTKNVTVEEYKKMITFKTAVLLGCSLKMGAINAETTEENGNHIYEFGKHLGIAFQLMDDLLDTFPENNSFGKQAGGDIIRNKKTFLLLKAFEMASAGQKEILSHYFNEKYSGESNEKIKNVVEVFEQIGIKSICIKEADFHTKKAISHLQMINANDEKKKNLEQFATALLNRTI